MNNESSQENSFNLEEFSRKSEEFYNSIKAELEPRFKGKYVAIDFVSKKYWIGETATEALIKAKDEFADKLFYLSQIGSSAPFSIQFIRIRPHPQLKYGFAR